LINYSIRPISKLEISNLKEFLYLALFVPPGSMPFPKSIIDEPIFKNIYDHWGKTGDIAFVAIEKSQDDLIGMAWVRLYDEINLSLGIIDTNIPALTIAIAEKYRNRGIGSALLLELIKTVKNQGIKGISLSVDNRNYAVKLYKIFGFKLYQESQEFNPLYLLKF
jgi:ribosomal protein S18 acetylase RimI-like enzyme